MPAKEEIAQYADQMGKTAKQVYSWFYYHRLRKTEPAPALGIKEEVEIFKDEAELAARESGKFRKLNI